jgi:hypothetical protein
MTAKKIHKSSIIGQQGVNLVEKVVLDMDFLWYPTGGIEAGIDGLIEIRDPTTGEVFNSVIQVQSKATQGTFQVETPDSFEYLCEEKDLEYWLQGNAPVILVVSRPSTDEAYWVSIKDYFQDLERRKERKIHFDKQRDRFDEKCRDALIRLAVPKGAGIYTAPPPKTETLISNLLSVSSFAGRLYIADTHFRSPRALQAELRRLGGDIGCEWMLKEKRILSFCDLEDYPWRRICDLGTLEDFDTEEWAYSDDPDRRREFVQLLNLALRQKVWTDLRYSDRKECYYFKATDNLSERKVSYTSVGGRVVERTVFKGYPSKRDPTRISFYRHSAFEGRFRLFGDTWYLEITPTYYFTWNGRWLDKWHESRLKGIKRLERHPAVIGQLIMWVDYLSRPSDMFTSQYPFLKFGDLERFEIEAGIDDELWLESEPDEEAEAARASLDELPLFKL